MTEKDFFKKERYAIIQILEQVHAGSGAKAYTSFENCFTSLDTQEKMKSILDYCKKAHI
jgi:hypothetical protein